MIRSMFWYRKLLYATAALGGLAWAAASPEAKAQHPDYGSRWPHERVQAHGQPVPGRPVYPRQGEGFHRNGAQYPGSQADPQHHQGRMPQRHPNLGPGTSAALPGGWFYPPHQQKTWGPSHTYQVSLGLSPAQSGWVAFIRRASMRDRTLSPTIELRATTARGSKFRAMIAPGIRLRTITTRSSKLRATIARNIELRTITARSSKLRTMIARNIKLRTTTGHSIKLRSTIASGTPARVTMQSNLRSSPTRTSRAPMGQAVTTRLRSRPGRNTRLPTGASPRRKTTSPTWGLIHRGPTSRSKTKSRMRLSSSAPNLGVFYTAVPYSDGTFGARLTKPPITGSPAFFSGLETGDVVLTLDGAPFRVPADVVNHAALTLMRLIDVRSGQQNFVNLFLP